jgi:hypothetical protein
MRSPSNAFGALGAALLLAACGAATDLDAPAAGIPAASDALRGGRLPGSTGQLYVHAYPYATNGFVEVMLDDVDLAGSVTVHVASTSSPRGEAVVLQEVAAGVGSFYGTIPTALATGDRKDGTLSVQPGDAIVATYVDRSDATGNRSTVQASVLVGPQPDLVADAVAGDLASTGFLSVRAQLHADAAGGLVMPCALRVYLSADGVADAGDFLVKEAWNGNLAAGDVIPFNFRVPLNRLPPGTWTLILVADGQGGIVEASETNNVAVSAAPVVIPVDPPRPPPDLTAAYVSIATSGATTTIVDRVSADALSAAPGDFVVRVYVAPEASVGLAVLVGERTVSGLLPGATSEGATVVPAGLVPRGYYQAYVVVDATNAVPEWIENNNTRWSTTRALIQ